MDYLRTRLSYLVEVRELEITEKMAEDVHEHWYWDDPFDPYTEDVPPEFEVTNSNPDNDKVFPALKVVVWPIPISEWPPTWERGIWERAAAVRYCFANSRVRTVEVPR
jgi:hypothetical protein